MGKKEDAPAEEPKRAIEDWESERLAELPRGAPQESMRAELAAARQLNQWANGRQLAESELDAGLARVRGLTFG